MRFDRSPVALSVLTALLDRFEQPQRRPTIRIRLKQKDYPLYFAADDSSPRSRTNRILAQLEQDGIVKLRWVSFERGNWIDYVDLVTEEVDRLYWLLQRRPPYPRLPNIEAGLAFETPLSAWHASFLGWARLQIANYRTLFPLILDDRDRGRDLLLALRAIAGLEQPTLERVLSEQLFGDSKRIETLRLPIVTMLQRHDPEAVIYGDDLDALLVGYRLERVPEHVPLAGPLQLQTNKLLDLAVFAPSIALPAIMLQTATIRTCAASIVVTVEHAASFGELAAARPEHVLAICTNGFATPTVIAFLRQLQAAQPDLRCYHWGACNAVGLRVLAHLRSQLGSVTPVLMDRRTVETYRAEARPLTSGDRSGLGRLRKQPLLDDCVELIDTLLVGEHKLDQAAVRAAAVLDELALSGDAA